MHVHICIYIYIYIYTLHNLSVLGLCLRINDSGGLFAWIGLTVLSQTYLNFLIYVLQLSYSYCIDII